MSKDKAKTVKVPCALNADDSFICECGRVEALGCYVAAHWREILKHTCADCGRTHKVCCGYVDKGRKPKAKK
jgi:hypothetical protein